MQPEREEWQFLPWLPEQREGVTSSSRRRLELFWRNGNGFLLSFVWNMYSYCECGVAGLLAIAQSKVGVIAIVGGRDERAGAGQPQGMRNVGLISGKSLLQLQAERIIKIQEVAKEMFPEEDCRITW